MDVRGEKMKIFKFKNGLTLLYKYRDYKLTSFSIGLNAGAAMEEGKQGLAHIVEHMLFKGTKKRNEQEINKEFDEIFGFNNAMTNFPYAIYYGTTLVEDFEKGLELYSDIILNSIFTMDLFKEELNVICEELNEWKDDLHQHCEDLAFYNGFNNRRIKELIIGKEEDIKNTTIEEVVEFYKKYYNPSNAVISVVTPKTFEETIEIIKSNFFNWSNNYNYNHQAKYEENIEGVFLEEREAISGAKINIGFTIHDLTQREIVALKILNYSLGIGTSSILYNKLRTLKGLVYDVSTKLKNERDIKMYTITLGTSKENIYKAINGVNEALNELSIGKYSFDEKNIKRIIKALRLKKELREQSCIRASIDLTLNHLMFGDGELIEKEFELMNEINQAEIIGVSKKIFNRLTIQIISPK